LLSGFSIILSIGAPLVPADPAVWVRTKKVPPEKSGASIYIGISGCASPSLIFLTYRHNIAVLSSHHIFENLYIVFGFNCLPYCL
jgi:hypothetical protein